MKRKIILFVFGFLAGVLFDMVPRAIEIMASTNVCAESCSESLRSVSLAAYAAMPIAWGIIFAKTIGKPHAKRRLLISALFSLTLMMVLTWFLYKHQHP
ncbi:hypothetical protein [Duganella sp. S19_KUP01_CR8]|uniref:hypothetical protein n=1 Tax=Duganella sp. S19_KUP01_CR8 TaxID=3025502 RepID=UPI002FCD8CEA